MPPRFTHFAAIDWSGAAGERHSGIAVAIMALDDPAPQLVRPGHAWSRGEVLEWLVHETPPHALSALTLANRCPLSMPVHSFPDGRKARPMHARFGRWSMHYVPLIRIWAYRPLSITRRLPAISAAMAAEKATCSAAVADVFGQPNGRKV
jgi:hypothetical protein